DRQREGAEGAGLVVQRARREGGAERERGGARRRGGDGGRACAAVRLPVDLELGGGRHRFAARVQAEGGKRRVGAAPRRGRLRGTRAVEEVQREVFVGHRRGVLEDGGEL